MSRSYEPPDGSVVQAFSFALDPTSEQAATIARFFGARRKAFNWGLEQIKAGIDHHKATGEETEHPSLYGLRKRWNAEKSSLCVDRETGEVWWPSVSKEVFADGVKGAVDGYWRWQRSKSGKIAGRRVGFPRFKKRGKDRDRFSFTTGAMRLEPDRRHLTMPVIGTVRTHENTRRIERLCSLGRAKVLSITVSRRKDRFIAAVKVAVSRPQRPGVSQPSSVVGVDVGVRASRPSPLPAAWSPSSRTRRRSSTAWPNCAASTASAHGARPVPLATARLRRRSPASMARWETSASTRSTRSPPTSPRPTARWWSKGWTRRGCCTKRASQGRERAGGGSPTQRLGRSGDSFATNAPGTGAPWSRPTGSSPRRRRATAVATSRTSAGPSIGSAAPAAPLASATTMQRSISPVGWAWAQSEPR